jgi:hypothetical protein
MVTVRQAPFSGSRLSVGFRFPAPGSVKKALSLRMQVSRSDREPARSGQLQEGQGMAERFLALAGLLRRTGESDGDIVPVEGIEVHLIDLLRGVPFGGLGPGDG